ncbi:MAG: hypothetical protein V4702_04885 [Patescibacteria group bacterium]
MINSTVRSILLIAALALIFIGFRFVTQAGQGLDAVQNDGYGGTGGFMILAGGYLLGYLTKKEK